MVKVEIKRQANGQVTSFWASGHAEADILGADIVCAAISAVMQTALLGLGEYLGLKERLTYELDSDGWLFCQLPTEITKEEWLRIEVIVETMIIGLKSIESEYGKYMIVEEEVE